MNLSDVVILNMDGVPDASGDYLDSNSVVRIASKEIYILDDHNGWPVGKATNVRGFENKLLADLEFFCDTLEPWHLRKPAFMGKCHVRNGRHISDCELRSIELTMFNVDDRIHPLGHYTPAAATTVKVEPVEKECRCESILFGHDHGCPWKR